MKFIDLIVISLIIGCIYLAVKVLKSGKGCCGSCKGCNGNCQQCHHHTE